MRPEVPANPVAAMPTASEPGGGAVPPALGSAAGQVDCDCAPQIRGYEITGRLGHGGMGIVWRATQRSTRRPVALKLLGSGLFATPQARHRFEREVQLTAKLEHPHVARVYESGVAEGVYFYAMELVEGVPLDAYVAEHRLPRRDALQLMRLVCEAVQHAHQRGVIHRDLKPSNILVTAGGEPKVLDFGLAKALQPDPQAEGEGQPVSIQGDVAGTPGFMSPEQAAGKPVDTRSDVYSLGVILYRLLTGRDPHGTTNWDPASFHRLATEDVVRPRTADRSIDRDLEALLLKALARDPDDRYATASGLARDLANYLAGDPLTAKRATLTYFARKRLRKHWLPATAALVVLAVLTGEAACSYRRLRVERNRFASSSLVNASLLHATGRDLDLAHLLAAAAGQAADTPQVREALIKLSTDWPRLHQFLHVPGGRVDAVAMSPNGRWLICTEGAAAGPDHPVWVWDLDSGQGVPKLRAHAARVTRLAFSPVDGLAASADAGGVIRLWDVNTWTPLGSALTGHTGAVHALAFSHDGKRLASGGVGPVHAGGPSLGNAGEVCLWDLRDVRRPEGVPRVGPMTAHTTPVHALAFSRNDRLLASGGGAAGTRFRGEKDSSVLVWDVETGGILTRQPLLAPERPEHRRGITALAFHPEEPTYLVSSSANGIVLVWDWERGALSENRAIVAPPPIRGIDSKAAALLPAEIDVAVLDIAFRRVPGEATGWQLLTASADGTVAVLDWMPQGYVDLDPAARFRASPASADHAAFSRDASKWAAVRSPTDGDAGGQIAVGQVDAPVGSVDPASLPTAKLMGHADRLANREFTPAERSRYLQGPAR